MPESAAVVGCKMCGCESPAEALAYTVCGHREGVTVAQQNSTRDQIAGFGLALRARREQAGLSLQQLGEQAGVHFTAISKLERGRRTPSLRVARDLAVALGVTVDTLLLDAARHAANE